MGVSDSKFMGAHHVLRACRIMHPCKGSVLDTQRRKNCRFKAALELKSAESPQNPGHNTGDLMTEPDVGLEVTVQPPDIRRILMQVVDPSA